MKITVINGTEKHGVTYRLKEIFFMPAITKRTLRGNFRTRADSITGNGTKRNGGRKKFNVKFIVKTSDFLYN